MNLDEEENRIKNDKERLLFAENRNKTLEKDYHETQKSLKEGTMELNNLRQLS